MGCVSPSEGVILCLPHVDAEYRIVRHCPTCKRRRRFYGWLQEWYGVTWTCCHCGDAWCDGELMPRPFERGWRQRSAADAKTRWRKVGA